MFVPGSAWLDVRSGMLLLVTIFRYFLSAPFLGLIPQTGRYRLPGFPGFERVDDLGVQFFDLSRWCGVNATSDGTQRIDNAVNRDEG